MIIEKKYNLEFKKNSTWLEVFKAWRKNEEKLKKWKEHYQERGFNSWEAWRKKQIKDLHCDKLNWSLYKIKTPFSVVPKFFGGPFPGWRDYFYNGQKTKSFAQLAILKNVQKYKGVVDIIKKFPQKTVLIGLVIQNKIFIIEGMHRSTAIALLKRNNKILKSDVVIFLAKFKKNKLPDIKMLYPQKI